MAVERATLSLPQKNVQQDEADAALERRIECARVAMTIAKDEASRRDHLERMERLISQRSQRRIEQMEIERGLRAP